jgi:hypothetical protein
VAESTEVLSPEEDAALRALGPKLRRRRRGWALGFAGAWSLQVTLVLLDLTSGWWRELSIHLFRWRGRALPRRGIGAINGVGTID